MPRLAPTYFEQQGNSFLFAKRLNPKKGTYPGFLDRLKRKLAATNEAEATREAAQLSNDLDHLQLVCLKDSKGHPQTLKDYSRATKTWLWAVEVDLAELQRQMKRHTPEGGEAKEVFDFLFDEVIQHFNLHLIRGGGDERDFEEYLTPFGDHLLGVLKEGHGYEVFSDCLPTYLKHTGRDHLPDSEKSVHDARRFLKQYVAVAGDKPIDQITRKDVERYIAHRLQDVKTTSVQREIASLRAIWAAVAMANDVRTQNPFAQQNIKALGTDSVKRGAPTLAQTRHLLAELGEAKAQVSTYVVPLIAVAALTGLRLSEAWHLEPDDWDREGGLLLVRPNRVRDRLKTTNSERPIPVVLELAEWLEVLFKRHRAKTSNSASAATHKWLRMKGFAFGAHGLRHGFKQRLTEINATLEEIQEIMGWSRQTMADQYGHKTVTDRKRALIRRVYAHMNGNTSGNVIPFRA